jgi:hypothetical protein
MLTPWLFIRAGNLGEMVTYRMDVQDYIPVRAKFLSLHLYPAYCPMGTAESFLEQGAGA